mgnify:CR=1 FL=1
MNDLDADFLAVIVAPFTGAWIEILISSLYSSTQVPGRTLHGCVD